MSTSSSSAGTLTPRFSRGKIGIVDETSTYEPVLPKFNYFFYGEAFEEYGFFFWFIVNFLEK